MTKINFIKNWNNKLNCNVFTTFRKWTQEKHDYYIGNKGKEFEVFVNGKKHCMAKLQVVEKALLKEIPYIFLAMDTGTFENPHSIFMKFGISPDDFVLILGFEKL